MTGSLFFLLKVKLPGRYLRNVSNYITNKISNIALLPSKTWELFYVDPLFGLIFEAHERPVNSGDAKLLAF